ncbi:MAG: hypothetical protein EA415_14550, partial [Sphaerobacteraceae bacterium]
MNNDDALTRTIHEAEPATLSGLADELSQSSDDTFASLKPALDDARVRRWVREYLLDRLEPDQRTALAEKLLEWAEDLDPARRDRSTAKLVEALTDEQLFRSLTMLAGSNAAGSLWERLSIAGEDAVQIAAEQVLSAGDAGARETTLHLLVLDPFGPEYLSHEQQDALLVRAMDDPDPELRGLAAEVIAAELPDLLLDRWDSAPVDDGERVRMAFWRAALAHRPDSAVEAATELVLGPQNPHAARRTALLALGENVSTRDVSPVLQVMLRSDDETLAEDAAQLMWRHHRTPEIANAAAESQFDDVRERANRLLHPEMGSPAAGGSRPGDPT